MQLCGADGEGVEGDITTPQKTNAAIKHKKKEEEEEEVEETEHFIEDYMKHTWV